MKPFLTTRGKMLELLVLAILQVVLYLMFWRIDVLGLFTLGFIWNWAASQDLQVLLENRRYRFSMVKLVQNLQRLVLKPFNHLPTWVQLLVKVLPAGLFWSAVIYFFESHMPWWATFLGSLAYELMQLEIKFLKRLKGSAV